MINPAKAQRVVFEDEKTMTLVPDEAISGFLAITIGAADG
jgi:hypothetical protein